MKDTPAKIEEEAPEMLTKQAFPALYYVSWRISLSRWAWHVSNRGKFFRNLV